MSFNDIIEYIQKKKIFFIKKTFENYELIFLTIQEIDGKSICIVEADTLIKKRNNIFKTKEIDYTKIAELKTFIKDILTYYNLLEDIYIILIGSKKLSNKIQNKLFNILKYYIKNTLYMSKKEDVNAIFKIIK